ncbi:MAG TPA: family 78 glycoside hydrolase catalytic domain [Terriglobales bacterium]|nr:family 78 glycoside hydrolase catalytic domain [Terriglobales bacterium]
MRKRELIALRESCVWRWFSGLVGFFVLASLLNAVPATLAAESGAPTHLECEAMQEPLGIDIQHPRLSWWLQDSRRGAKQTAYQIRVASSAEKLAQDQADVWDSGKVESGESVNVPYGGPAVESRHRYYWQVRAWDQAGDPSPYSQATWWEMGLLSPQDWKAKWITRDLPAERGDYESGVKWIWAANENGLTNASAGKHEFRLRFNLGESPKDATLFITAKDNVAAWVDGRQVLEPSPATGYGEREPWGHFRVIPAGKLLSKGANVVAAEAIVNESRDNQNSAGFIALLRVTMRDGKIQRFVSGPDWKTAAQQTGNWFAKNFDDSSWPNAVAIADVGSEQVKFPWPALPASLLRREFSVAKQVRSARIYSTALGSYQLYLNGKRVGNDVLAPGWTDYSKRIVYQVYDVTSQVRQGGNALGAILGDGWYASGLSWLQTRYNFGPPPVRLLVQLEVEYSDGSRDSVVSDGSWKAAQSPILQSEIYSGEDFDARLEQSGWDQPGFAAARWEKVAIATTPEAPLVAEDFQPMRVELTLKPKTMNSPKPGVYIFDLGQNMVGWARLHVAGRAGTKVRLRFGEVLQNDGELYTANLRTAAATDTYILRGKGDEVFEPHFTFHGFRYIELTGYPGTPPQDAVEGVVFHTDAPFTIQFKTANAIVNQLWSNILWGQRGNFLSVPTDCPQRDERLGWMGDAEVFWRTAAFDANLASFSHKFTADIRDAQRASGGYTDVSPYAGNVSNSVAGWADAGVIIPWTAYLQYDDKTILRENWDAMEKWMTHLESANPNYLWLKERGNDYGDWLAIGSETSKDMIATAYWAYDAELMTRIAGALGRSDDEEKYRQVFDKVRAAFIHEYVKPDGTVGTGSQTSYVLALHMNLLPPGMRATAAEKLVEDIKAHDGHLTTGFLGTPYLMLELSNSGHSDVAYELLFNRTYPSWGYMIEHGATTMWERWNGDQMMGDPSMNSYNHYAYGAVAEWLYRYAAGIDESAESPGFHDIVLHPQFNRELGEAEATYESPYGKIASSWKAGGGTVTWDVTVPANTQAMLYFPGDVTAQILEGGADIRQSPGVSFVLRDPRKAVYEAGAGTYHFTIQR